MKLLIFAISLLALSLPSQAGILRFAGKTTVKVAKVAPKVVNSTAKSVWKVIY